MCDSPVERVASHRCNEELFGGSRRFRNGNFRRIVVG